MVTRRTSRNLARKAAKEIALNVEREREKSQTTPPPTTPTIYNSVPRDEKGYLQRIYTAADQIYRRGRTKPRTPRLVNGIIIQARCAQVLAHLSDDGRAAYLAAVARTIPSLGGRAQVVAEHMRRMGRKNITARRFSAFVDRFGFLLLSVCAHSKSFRFIVLHAHLGNRNQTLWRHLCNLIESHAYSIELYARTRGLDLETPLTEGDEEWNQLSCRSLYDVLAEHSTFTEDQVLGISDTEYLKRHALPDDVGHYHEWVLSSEPKTAYNPEITYRAGSGRNSRLVTERQINIDSSIILDKPVWVNRPHWPIDDPRYRSLASDPCEICLVDINNGGLVLKYCNHTLADLCKRNGSKIDKASSRVELLHYVGKGVGVRALKAFRKNEIMAEYVGEIYPETIIRKNATESVDLYRSDNWLSYRFQQSLEARDLNKSSKKKPLSPGRECDNMIIDPAIRGNWTRYMNHSCREATSFAVRFIGNKKLTLVVASRDIQFGEEVTVHYGADYWKAVPYGCACGEDQCKLWDPEKNKTKGGNKVTWAEKQRLQIDQEAAMQERGNNKENGRNDKGKKSTAKGLKQQTKKTPTARQIRQRKRGGGDKTDGGSEKKIGRRRSLRELLAGNHEPRYSIASNASFRPLMTICCLYRHISYAPWRYQIFQCLFATPGNFSTVPPVKQHQVAGGHTLRRISKPLRTLAQDDVAHNLRARFGTLTNGDDRKLDHVQDNPDQDNTTTRATAEAEWDLQLGAGRFPPVEEDHISQLSQRGFLQNEKHENAAQEKLVTSEKGGSHKEKPLKRRQQWSPYDTRGTDDLRILAATLQKSLESSGVPRKASNEVASQMQPKNSLPVSPLIQALEQEKPSKSPVKGVEKEELANNPWATMLASPLRFCAATGVRLPKDLLVPWGLVKNPATDEVYFMPTRLAELGNLKDKRRSSELSASASLRRSPTPNECHPNPLPDSFVLQDNADRESDRKRADEPLSTNDLQNNHTGEDTRPNNRPSTSQASKSPLVIYMLPFVPLLHHLTHRFTYLQKDMVTRRSKPNAINSILPWRLKARIDRANFYAIQRTKTLLSSTPKEALNALNALSLSSFQNVKWGLEIDEVMLRVLRERLLVALEMLGNRNQKLWRQERELVKATRVIRTSDATANEGSWILQADDENTKPANGRGEGSDAKCAKISLLVEYNGASSPILQQRTLTNHDQLNEEETTQASRHTLSHLAEPSAAMNEGREFDSDLEPSNIQLDQSSSVPLFPLNFLLGADYISRFRQLSAGIGGLAPRKLPPSDVNEHSYILTIPASAFGGNSVIEEVWRLWRFLGGRRA